MAEKDREEGIVLSEKSVLERMHMRTREEAVAFLKSMWNETPHPCPYCRGQLDFLHKKAKKSNCDWICTGCGARFDTIKILMELNER